MRPNQVFHRAFSEVLEWLVLFKLGEFPCRRMPIGDRWINWDILKQESLSSYPNTAMMDKVGSLWMPRGTSVGLPAKIGAFFINHSPGAVTGGLD